jgi:predicted enzyme related to lactoylglutathione lyase
VLDGPFDASPAGRIAVLADPDGAVFCVWQPSERQGAQLVNEPSAWAMSMLHTNDPVRAEEFYAGLFGWQVETLETGETSVGLFRLPGYVGGEPDQPVARDVVAVMGPMDEPAPPRWSIDFWIEDADRAAAGARELGGEVLVAPHDRAGFRSAVLSDPSGAVFSVSRLMMAAT